MPTWTWFIFVTAIGACIGSFLNVVICRLPEGKSLITPGSRCPKCGHVLSWFENIPILSWIFLRGRCRKCKAKISVQYPIVEALCAFLFGGIFIIYYYTSLRPEFATVDSFSTAPVFAVQLILLAGLLAATVIDSKFFIIPIIIPWAITLAALVILPVAAQLGLLPDNLANSSVAEQIAPIVTARGIGIATGGAIGLIISLILLRFKILPRSFDIEKINDEVIMDNQASNVEPSHNSNAQELEDFLKEYPHPRQEVLKELLFLVLPVLGMIIGGWLGSANNFLNVDYQSSVNVNANIAASEFAPQIALYWRVLAGVFCGYLMGGGLVWGTRILGTLGFGKEAMGLGDVHLLAAIGAVLGPVDVIYIFFIAPFLGLIAVILIAGVAALLKERQRVIPYGPYLAGAALVIMIFRQPILSMFNLG